MTTLPRYLNYNIPAISVQFDDGILSVYTEAYAYMSTLGMAGTAYIYDNAHGPSVAQLGEMYAAGWDIGNHTNQTAATLLLPNMSLEDQTTALGDCTTYLEGLGFTRSAKHVTYPTGAYNADTLTAMTNLGLLTGKTLVRQTRENMRYHAANPLLWTVDAYNSANPDNFYIDYFEACQTEGRAIGFVFHDIVASGASGNQCNRANFRAIIDWIHASGMPVLTVSQMYALLSGDIEY